ncbi:MAG: mucoidy inhibitor MuiA family protein [Chitinophagales bacterium]|nr:mucoidy inhibitor MuiA family protein [Chitinophagaceae bacterium]MCB9065352.1 mucoidy inhibitor MuiA family protein [Chitinophagales bacterium]
MLSKRSFLVVVCFLTTLLTYAQTQHKLDIKQATVFLRGAELYSTTKISLQAGETEVLFTNVAGNINLQSLNVGADNGAVVQSAVFRNNYLQDETLSPRAKEIKDSIEYLEDRRHLNNNKIQSVETQIDLLKNSKNLNGKELSASDIQQLLGLIKNNMNSLMDEKTQLTKLEYDYVERIQKLQRQLNEEKQKGFQPGGQVLVKLFSKKATTSNIEVSYVVPNAGWAPSYDLRVDDINKPVQLAYKAHVYQNSGVEWNKIKLTLSTGNPNEGAEAPNLNPWYLAFYRPITPQYMNQTSDYESLPMRKSKSMAPTSAGVYNDKAGSELSISGGRGDGSLYMIDGAQVSNSSIQNYVAVDNQGVNTLFDIELPYSIPSDGKQINVAVKTATLPATYRYFVVPKLDRDAFLQAQITGWEELNLLPAQTNIFYEGTYVGQGYIDVRNVKDTMNLSLGRDKKIVVRRERDMKLQKRQTVGSNIKESFAYTISVRNTRSKPMDIVVLDQFPVSNNNDIDISDKSMSGAEYNEQTGILKWKLQIQPNETKDIHMGYTVKYPKGKQVNL